MGEGGEVESMLNKAQLKCLPMNGSLHQLHTTQIMNVNTNKTRVLSRNGNHEQEFQIINMIKFVSVDCEHNTMIMNQSVNQL